MSATTDFSYVYLVSNPKLTWPYDCAQCGKASRGSCFALEKHSYCGRCKRCPLEELGYVKVPSAKQSQDFDTKGFYTGFLVTEVQCGNDVRYNCFLCQKGSRGTHCEILCSPDKKICGRDSCTESVIMCKKR